MDIKKLTGKMQEFAGKYKYALLVFIIGLALLMIPDKSKQPKTTEISTKSEATQQALTQESLERILGSVQGAGKVKVLLSIAAGEETVYQTDTDIISPGNSKIQTVITSDSQRNEVGLIRQVNPVTYAGAIVVCQGADSPAVRLAVTQAVSKITGLGCDAICVLKMQ